MKAILLATLLLGCSGKSSTTTGGSGSSTTPVGSGSGSGSSVAPDKSITSCDSARTRVEGLYRAEGMTTKEAKRIDAYVADNWQMVAADCAKAPDKVVPCLAAAGTVADLESKCLEQLDDEGTEGDKLKKGTP